MPAETSLSVRMSAWRRSAASSGSCILLKGLLLALHLVQISCCLTGEGTLRRFGGQVRGLGMQEA